MDHAAPRLDRPVFIMAAPRSCSTLLFQTLARNSALYSLGDESHRLFESHPKLSPGRGFVDSNRVTADVLDERLAHSIRTKLLEQVRDSEGRAPAQTNTIDVRLLEKTPKHALRIPFLDALFPDARYIYLFREPRRNIASIIEAWLSGRFVTYPRFPTRHGPWSLLLPPGWKEMTGRPLEEIAAFQWRSANRCIMQDLAAIAAHRWTAINADELLQDAPAAVKRLCEFMEVPVTASLLEELHQPLPLSRYTLSRPSEEKWRQHGAEIARVWPGLREMVPRINAFVAGRAQCLDEAAADDFEPQKAAGTAVEPEASPARVPASRNAPCPCGSGQRYKLCHGRMT